MNQEKIIELKSGFETAFIDATINSNLAYKPQFIYIKPSDLTCLYQKKQTAPTVYSLRPISSERLKKK